VYIWPYFRSFSAAGLPVASLSASWISGLWLIAAADSPSLSLRAMRSTAMRTRSPSALHRIGQSLDHSAGPTPVVRVSQPGFLAIHSANTLSHTATWPGPRLTSSLIVLFDPIYCRRSPHVCSALTREECQKALKITPCRLKYRAAICIGLLDPCFLSGASTCHEPPCFFICCFECLMSHTCLAIMTSFHWVDGLNLKLSMFFYRTVLL